VQFRSQFYSSVLYLQQHNRGMINDR
jgi:hypothetical protein